MIQKLNAISLWQPWASAMGHYKNYETRHWQRKTLIGQWFLFHAAKNVERSFFYSKPTYEHMCLLGYNKPSKIPRGCALSVARLVAVHDSDEIRPFLSGRELHYGNYRSGRMIWEFQDFIFLPSPVPMTGHRSIWSITRDQYQEEIWQHVDAAQP